MYKYKLRSLVTSNYVNIGQKFGKKYRFTTYKRALLVLLVYQNRKPQFLNYDVYLCNTYIRKFILEIL